MCISVTHEEICPCEVFNPNSHIVSRKLAGRRDGNFKSNTFQLWYPSFFIGDVSNLELIGVGFILLISLYLLTNQDFLFLAVAWVTNGGLAPLLKSP